MYVRVKDQWVSSFISSLIVVISYEFDVIHSDMNWVDLEKSIHKIDEDMIEIMIVEKKICNDDRMINNFENCDCFDSLTELIWIELFSIDVSSVFDDSISVFFFEDFAFLFRVEI